MRISRRYLIRNLKNEILFSRRRKNRAITKAIWSHINYVVMYPLIKLLLTKNHRYLLPEIVGLNDHVEKLLVAELVE